ncbi:diacylglycerol O-acyltransferase [Nocardioides thalensis]|uniref:Diacylglycerol O-acyltransferase n=1 Tax=Nocardioides thalensis TaxID=1914755 RepID=A0A853C7D1_9ACTN|nr:wax ester/triacylglycerol synthase family O-acyltransferase [Nocardioides thalensis]NYJ03139.1 diacylglycerol O-acyltransferase [Nocardioides thalensis]
MTHTRMTGADASFLYLETPSVHMHTLKIAVVEPNADMTFDNLVAGTLARLRQMPALRRRVVPVPFHLNHPVVVTQRRIEPTRHFFRHHLGGAATWRDVEEAIGRIAGQQLARDVPLWQIHLLEGLADGSTVIVGKIHHSLADGNAANAMLGNLTDIRTADGFETPWRDPADATPLPSRARLALEALRDAVLQVGLLPRLLAATARGVVGMLRYRRRTDTGVPVPVAHAPRVSFNGPLTPLRSFATVTLPLADLKAVRKEHGVTLNDVVLGVVSGALRRWMAEHGERPAMSLTAGVPVGLDHGGSGPRLVGNAVSNLFTTLATDVDDPAERLRRISRTAAHAKEINKRLGSTMLTEWSQFTPPAPFSYAVRLYSRFRAARLHPAAFSAIVSNVPGPRERISIGGARLSDIFSVGPLVDGIGLNVTVWSYVDRMNFSLLACPDLLPDVEALAAYLPAALDELRPDREAEKQRSSGGAGASARPEQRRETA